MRLTYWKAFKNYENGLADSIVGGAAAAGIEIVIKPTDSYRGPEGDGSMIMGVVKREILWDHQEKGVPLLYFDKGYCRERQEWNGGSIPAWWRMCWQDVHPTAYLMLRSRSSDRWDRLGMKLQERALAGKHGQVVLIGSSAKFHLTAKLDDPTAWAARVVKAIGRHHQRRIVYRPKPSWKYAEAVPGAVFDHGQKTAIAGALAGAFCTVTYGSIGCVDSIIAGVPCIVLGNGVAKSVSGNYLHDVANPPWASRRDREQWAANLAYSNFSPAEIADGTAWKILKEQMSYAI